MRISSRLPSRRVHLSLRVQFVAVTLVWFLTEKCLQGEVVVEAKSSLEDCRVIQFKPATHNRSLMGHVIKGIWVTSEEGCEANCFAEDDCMSINFGPKSQEKHLCELSSSDHNLHPEDLKERLNFIYKSTWNHCPRSPCNPGYRCQVGFTSKGYRCIDINECIEGGDECHVNAICTNIAGSYNCSCKEGYFKNGQLCAENWKKINKIPVCFRGLDDNYGTFRINESGLIYTFKLVYQSGSMKCLPTQKIPRIWGCTQAGFGKNQLLTVVTHPNRSVLFPVDYLRDNNNCYKYYAYHLEGIDVNSPELVFNRLISPMSVTEGQEFQVWHGEDLSNCGEKDNTGQICVDVHGWYT